MKSNEDNKYVIDYLKNEISQDFIDSLESIISKCVKAEYGTELINNDQYLQDFKTLVVNTKKIKVKLIPYSEITRIIYSNKNCDGLDILIIALNESIIKEIEGNTRDCLFDYQIILIKTVEHIQLAWKQISLLYEAQEEEIRNQEKILIKIQKDSKKLEDRVGEVSNTLDNNNSKVYSDFIAILGIFASIIVTMFAGLSSISNAITAITNEKLRIYSLLMMSSLFTLFLTMVIFMLLISISKMTKKNIKSCCDENSVKCKHSFIDKYPFFCYIILVSFSLFIIFWIISSLIHHQ